MITTRDIAQSITKSQRTIERIAKSQKIGRRLSGGQWVFTPGEAKRIKRMAKSRVVGNPLMGPGYYKSLQKSKGGK